MIRIENLTLGYGGRRLLDTAAMHLAAGEATALIGRNGTGKSTLLRALAGLERPLGGRIFIGGRELAALGAAGRAATLAFVNTERVRIPNLRCRDVVALGRAPYTNWFGRMQPQDAAIVDRALGQVGMTAYADRTLGSLSDGECQRVMIARALAQQTPVILLDEPTSFLDFPARHETCRLLRDLAREAGKCILFSTHEIEIAQCICDRIVLLDPPQLHCMTPAELAASGLPERLFGVSLPAEAPTQQ